jgi:hypothetical protein
MTQPLKSLPRDLTDGVGGVWLFAFVCVRPCATQEAAEKKRVFEVIVAESAPNFAGQDMAKSLAAAGIETTVIPDSAVFAIMARVNQVCVVCGGRRGAWLRSWMASVA